MKTLMLTSAILLATSGIVAAQTGTTEAPAEAAVAGEMAQGAMVPGFRASEFTGMNLYTLSPDAVTELRAARPADPAWDERAARWTSGETFIAGRDQWDDIGRINDIILSQDGEIQGVLLDIGGFLGMGSRTVMVGTNDLYFVADTATPDDLGDFFVVASLSRQQLEALPEWSDDNLTAGYSWDDHAALSPIAGEAADATTAAPVAGQRAAVSPTSEELTGAAVQDMAGENIGSVSDLVLNGDTLSGAVIDVGGFLGIGARSVLVPVDTLTVIRDADNAVVRIETSLTREQLEALPEHRT
ncbi:PRC-barrel domain-containing protein [Rhodobacter sp. 24-YEA-8]|uniref:PRC-barrel domain-containing protein n=1 Tax=Rhodobacter sp. 24-YEA-8 TaxID=1884310 RepID=UPI00089A9E88|nr:PRC-barrel domain-containing protein [Rhodobacter sp. 24-YEA-8]SED59962.1 PRC-barrel domain-containing protein [Rhodobacter sp. 24-YEA-8]